MTANRPCEQSPAAEAPLQRAFPETSSGKLLALDVGLARIGVAVCDPLQLRARPLSVIQRASRRQDFERIANIVRNEEAVAVICGLPLNMDGSEGDQARTVRKWAMRLAQALRVLLGEPMPIIFWDERLSTFDAHDLGGVSAYSEGEDAVAAAVILQRYLVRGENEEYGSILLPAKNAPPIAQQDHEAKGQ